MRQAFDQASNFLRPAYLEAPRRLARQMTATASTRTNPAAFQPDRLSFPAKVLGTGLFR
jgi:hypothetical protein